MSNHFPYDVYTLDSYGLSYHALARFKQLLYKENLPADIAEKIEEELIPALEYIEGWEPTDDMISAHIESRGVF